MVLEKAKHASQLIFLGVWLAISLVCILVDPAFYRPILGALNPIIVFSISGILAFVAFRSGGKDALQFLNPSTEAMTLFRLFILSMALGCMPIAIDLLDRFPENMNVLYPRSLLYYPTIGVLAEIIFHVLPSAILMFFFRKKIRKYPWILIILVATVEPAFQVIFGLENGQFSTRDALVFLEVFLFGVFQLYAFLKHGFVAIFLCRMGFYVTWHLVWGAMRLILM